MKNVQPDEQEHKSSAGSRGRDMCTQNTETVGGTNGEIFSESCSIKPNLDFNYVSPINLAPNGIPLI